MKPRFVGCEAEVVLGLRSWLQVSIPAKASQAARQHSCLASEPRHKDILAARIYDAVA